MNDDDWTTLSVRKRTAKEFNEIKKEAAESQGAGDYSADTFINVLLGVWTDDEIMLDDGGSVDEDAVAREVADAVVADLRAQLPGDVADEVEARLR